MARDDCQYVEPGTRNQEPVNWLEDFNLCLLSDRKFCKFVKSIFMTCKAKLEMK